VAAQDAAFYAYLSHIPSLNPPPPLVIFMIIIGFRRGGKKERLVFVLA